MAEIIAFSASQASRLTRLSLRQLRYWDNTRFFRPSLAEDLPHSRFARVYAFKDIVGLRALSQMRKAHGIPLQQLRQVGSYLARQTAIDFPLLADFFPHGAVSEKYGVLLPNGVSERAVIGIDKQGTVRYIHVSPILEIPELGPCAVALG